MDAFCGDPELIVPAPGRQPVLEELHNTHLGASKIKALSRAYIWWPKMDDIDNLMHGQILFYSAFTSLGMACTTIELSPLRFCQTFLGHMYLVLVDTHSKWLDVQIMQSTTSENTIRKLQDIFSTHGLPQKIVIDNESAFNNATFKAIMDRNGIRYICSPPYHPSTNCLAERAVQMFKQSLRQILGRSVKEKLVIQV